jgi:hypothetical protein
MPDSPLALDISRLAHDVENTQESKVPWASGKIANVRIEQARQLASDSRVLAQIDPFEPTADGRYIDHLPATVVASVLRQVAGEVPKLPPAMPVVSQRDSIMGDIAHKQW